VSKTIPLKPDIGFNIYNEIKAFIPLCPRSSHSSPSIKSMGDGGHLEPFAPKQPAFASTGMNGMNGDEEG
jgi:hypothetical protein